jgi:hypothetical protein
MPSISFVDAHPQSNTAAQNVLCDALCWLRTTIKSFRGDGDLLRSLSRDTPHLARKRQLGGAK